MAGTDGRSALADAICSRFSLSRERLEIGGVAVWVQTLSAADKMEMLALKNEGDRMVLVVSRACVNEDGTAVFTDPERVRRLHGDFCIPVWNKALQISNLAEDKGDEGKAGAPTGDSPSA